MDDDVVADSVSGDAGQDDDGRWCSITEAALLLKVHPRTVQRRIDAGRLRGRAVDGHPEVLLPMEVSGDVSGNVDDRQTVSDRPPDSAVVLADDHRMVMAATAGLADRLAVTAEGQARRSRRSAMVAWSTVAALVVAGGVAVWAITDAAGRLREAQADAAQASRAAAERLQDATGRLASAEAAARERAGEAARLATEARQAERQVVDLERQLIEADAAVEVAQAEARAARAERDAARLVRAGGGDVPGGGVATGQR